MRGNRQQVDPRLASTLPHNMAREIIRTALILRNDLRDEEARLRVPEQVRTAVAALEASQYLSRHRKPYVVVAFGNKEVWAIVKHLKFRAAEDRHARWPLAAFHPGTRGYAVLRYGEDNRWRPRYTFDTWSIAVSSVAGDAPLRRMAEFPGRSKFRTHIVAGALARRRAGYVRRATTRPTGLLIMDELVPLVSTYARDMFG